MKKFALIGLAFCLVFAFTAPAMALDVDFSGYYKVRGFSYHDYESFGYDGYPTEHASNYYDMLLDVNIVFKVHPRLKLITNFTALDKVWGEMQGDRDQPHTTAYTENSAAMGQDSNNIDWNKAYMEINTGLGTFEIGRMDFGGFNHDFISNGGEEDCIQYTLIPKDMGGPRWNPLLFTLAYAKIQEEDAGTGLGDEDIDQYRMTLGYFSDNLIIDNMIRFERNEFSPTNNL